jgi:chromate reductase, NAD(P)H dehydrogenase (quinone)
MKKKIFALSGSTRKNSSNWKFLNIISDLYKDSLEIEIYDQIDELPHFNPDLKEDKIPTIVKEFLDKIDKADGILIFTPEYVFSLPAVLKNALEWTVSETILSYKPMAFIVASSLGDKTFESLDLILKTLVQTEIPTTSKLLIQGTRGKFDATDKISDEVLNEIKKVVDSLILTINHKF